MTELLKAFLLGWYVGVASVVFVGSIWSAKSTKSWPMLTDIWGSNWLIGLGYAFFAVLWPIFLTMLYYQVETEWHRPLYKRFGKMMPHHSK